MDGFLEWRTWHACRWQSRRPAVGVIVSQRLETREMSDAHSFPHFFDSAVRVRLAEEVFAHEDVFRFAIDESDQSVLPIADVVAKANVEDQVAQIVAVEEEPESVDDTMTLIDDNKDCRGVTTSAVYLGCIVGPKWSLGTTLTGRSLV